jgi:hypothetical protein
MYNDNNDPWDEVRETLDSIEGFVSFYSSGQSNDKETLNVALSTVSGIGTQMQTVKTPMADELADRCSSLSSKIRDLLSSFTDDSVKGKKEKEKINMYDGITDELVIDLIKDAENGDIKAQYMAALTFKYGEKGTPVSLRKAMYWYSKAAKQGHMESQYALGFIMATSDKSSDEDRKKGKYWLEKASEQGHAEATYQLGMENVTNDALFAEELFIKAADMGSQNAIEILSTNNPAVEIIRDSKKLARNKESNMENQETKNRIIMSIGAVLGLIIGIAVGASEGVLFALLGAWIGLGIGGNIMPFFSEIGYKLRNAFLVGDARGDSMKDNIISSLLYIVSAILWRLLKYALYGAVLYVLQMIAGDWERFSAE